MKYEEKLDRIIVTEMKDFDIEDTLECGQCFRFMKITDHGYVLIAHGRVIKILQKNGQIVLYHTTKQEFEDLWISYFDFNRDYGKIKQTLEKIDPIMKNAVNYKAGIHLLRQEVWECLISFIISQNKKIPHIKQVIQNLSYTFGKRICTLEGCDYYSFPSVKELSTATESEIRACKAGFRAPYIIDAVNKVKSGEVDLEGIHKMDTQTAREELLKIKGVGPKIADCVLLFSLGRYEVFPTDVWVKRIMEYFYFHEETNIKEIHILAQSKFGQLAGFAQQYLFFYAREKNIGK